MILQQTPSPYYRVRLLITVLLLSGISFQTQARLVSSSVYQQQQDTVYASAEHSAQFPGGIIAFNSFIEKNLKRTQEMAIGKIFLQFVVRKDGSLTDVKVVRGLNNSLNDEEAVRVIKLSPQWQPATQNGQAVSMQFTVPIVFN